MNLNHLEYFEVLAKWQHYGRAAEELNISQPSLSNAIHRLEQELGVYLIEKQGRNVVLTYYGRRYLEYIRRGLTDFREGSRFLEKCSDRERGLIRVGAVSSAGPGHVLPLMRDFLKLYPEVPFEYVDGTSHLLMKELRESRYDMVFCAGNEQDPDFLYLPLWEQRFVAIAAPDHALAACPSVSLAQLGEYPLIRYHPSAAARQVVDGFFHAAGVQQRTCCEVSYG